MAIKWKNWTARLPAKIICFLLVPVFLTLCAAGSYVALYQNTGTLELLFADLSQDHYFYNRYVDSYRISAFSTLLQYKSEEAIRRGDYIQWVQQGGIDPVQSAASYTNVYRDDSSYVLIDKVTGREWAYSDTMDAYEERSLISDQINDYRWAREQLEELEEAGLLYYAGNGAWTLSNTEETGEDFFAAHPVYLIVENGYGINSSHTTRTNYFFRDLDVGIRLAFPQTAVDSANAAWKQQQSWLYSHIAFPVLMLVCACLCFAVLLLGAGRRPEGEGTVYYSPVDKPYLDVGLALVLLWEIILLYAASELRYSIFYRYSYDGAPPLRNVGVFCAVFITAGCVPALLWVLNVMKRIKGRCLLRHTLCHTLWRRLGNFARTLWSGARPTSRAALAGLAVAALLLLSAAFPPLLLLLALGAILAVLRFSRSLVLLEEGAVLAAQGKGYPPLREIRGLLRPIAGSLADISSGVNAAVEARMRSEKMKTELITNVSHDIRTPLTSLITYTDLLRSEGLDSDNAPEYLEVLIQKSQRLKTLTDELFEAAKAASGNVEVHLEELDLAALVEQCLGELDERVRESGLQFLQSLPEKVMVHADGRLLSRVMENLLTNALKYSLPGSRVYLSAAREGDLVRLEVKNISAAPLNMDPAELTERFTRGDSARSSEGSGLGLSIVQSFVEAMGGRFSLRIDGDLFKAAFTIPAAKGPDFPGLGG